MELPILVLFLALIGLAYQIINAIYNLYFHPLAAFPGPKLAAISTLYRAYHHCWRDGKLLFQVIELHEHYGPVVRISPNELAFNDPNAFHDIYNRKFDGIKDPDYYHHLGGVAETFFTMGNPAEHSERFRPVASLFSKRFYDQFEPRVRENIYQFSTLLASYAKDGKPCNLAMGYRSLFLKIVMDFIFSSTPDHLRSLASESFDDPLTVQTLRGINWTMALSRNFPNLSSLIYRLPRALRTLVTDRFEPPIDISDIIKTMTQHEKNDATAVDENSMVQRLMKSHVNGKSSISTPLSDLTLESEAEVTMWGGVLDLTNILQFGTYMVSRNSELQDRLYEELKSVWADQSDSAPSFQTLHNLPLLNGVVKESMRLTYGVANGPPRLVGLSGANINGYRVPAKAVVFAPSYFVHMDTAVFPNPEEFDPARWAEKDHSNSLVTFSKGPRMCPAEHLSSVEMFLSFATVFRRFHLTPYETTMNDFTWNEHLSIVFTGRPLQAILESRIA